MQISTHPPQVQNPLAKYPPLEAVNTPAVETAAAAFYLRRQPQTLRGWACSDSGPLRPIRVAGRLAWKTADLRRILEVA